MTDASHIFGQDIGISPSGDIATVSGLEQGRQRVIRRLLTNPGELPFQPTYGGGLGAFVGLVANPNQIGAIVRAQMTLEADVAQTPEPDVVVTVSPNGVVILSITYTDASSSQIAALGFQIGQNSITVQ